MVTISDALFEKIFPFFVRIDKQMNVISSGPSMKKILGDIVGRDFSEVFKFVRPSLSIRYEFNSLKEHQDIVIILESVEFPLRTRFRGQFIFDQQKEEITYLNSPWITNVQDLGFYNLLVTDFAVHDTITDNLQLLQSKEIVNEDMRRITDELIVQRNELIDKNETIIELARFPDQNPQPILRVDFEGKLLYANSAANYLIENEELMLLPFWGTIYLRFETNGFSTYEREFSIGKKIFHATIVPIRLKRYFNVYLRDITKTLEFQHELMNASSRLQTLIGSMHSAILAEDIDRKIILTNQIFCDLFEIPLEPDAMKGMDSSNSAENAKFLFVDEEGFIARINDILVQRKRVDGDILKMKNGKIVERDFLPIYEEGAYKGHIWKYQDITEIMQTKESLKKVEEKYRRIIENLELGLIEVDLNENISKVYPAFSLLTGYTETELLGMNARELLAFEEDRLKLDEQNTLREKGLSSVYETKIRTKNGDVKYVIISGAPIYDSNNAIVGSLGVHVDITDRKKLEKDLVEANEKALHSVKLKEKFVANMSHEIRTPMNVIIGMMDLIGDEGLNDDQKRYLSTIKRSADALLELINDLLDYSKIEAGQLNLEMTKLNLFEIFGYLEQSFVEEARNKEIELSFSISSDISPLLISDSLKMKQVFFNLIGNAIKFTEKGYVRVSAELIKENEREQEIKFSIVDTGVGIAVENLESIFNVFEQEDSSVSRKFGGTGLGLSITREIVTRLGGRINVQSKKGEGSEFSFVIVISRDFESNSMISDSHEESFDLNGIRILVAEDNSLNQILISAILNQSGVIFDVVENGNEVIASIEAKSYDLILMDIQMPVLDGISATKHIRNVLGSNIPIIALTANASAKDEALYRSIGMNGYLAKPFKKEELCKLIYSLMDRPNPLKSLSNEIDVSVSADSIYTLKHIAEIAGDDDPDFIQSIVETFRTSIPEYISQIELALENNDFQTVKKIAHQLKPSMDIFGMIEEARLIRILEDESSKVHPDKTVISNCLTRAKGTLDLVIADLYSKF